MSQQFESIAIGIASSSTLGFRSAELAALAYCIILPTFVICQGRGAAVKVQYNVLQLRPSMPRHCHGQYARISSFSILHERPGLQPKQSHICACVCCMLICSHILFHIYIYLCIHVLNSSHWSRGSVYSRWYSHWYPVCDQILQPARWFAQNPFQPNSEKCDLIRMKWSSRTNCNMT